MTRRAWGFESGEDAWQSRAACRPVDGRPVAAPDMDTVNPAEAARLIDQYCSRCPVVAQCDTEARGLDATYRHSRSGHRISGVWGGLLWKDGKPRAAREVTAA